MTPNHAEAANWVLGRRSTRMIVTCISRSETPHARDSSAGSRRRGSGHANRPTCPPVCQNITLVPSRNRPSRAKAMSPASALAVYQ